MVRLREEYQRFSKAADLRTEEERLEVAGFSYKQGDAALKVYRNDVAKYSAYRYNKDGSIVATDDWTAKKAPHLDTVYKPNAVVDMVSRGGSQRDRLIYDAEGKQIKQISNGPHGNPQKASIWSSWRTHT